MTYLKLLWLQVRESFFYYLAVITIILLWSWAWGLTFFTLVAILVGSSWLRLLLTKQQRVYSYIKAFIFVFLLVAAFWFLPRLIGWWFIWVLLVGFIAYRFWRGRRLLMNSMRFIETKLFGKPLDKKEWKKAEKPSIYEEDEE